MIRRNFIAGAVSFAVLPARASEKIGKAEAIAGDRFRAGGDEEFHLTDILAPSAYDLHRDAQPFFGKAKAMLNDILADSALEIVDSGERNRWGARLVSARLVGDALTLQERLVAKGAARVAPATDDHEFIEQLLNAERIARQARAGLWRLRAYRVFDAADAEDAIGGFHLVEGTVQSAQAGRGRFYLNFGADYREDFTATAPSRRAKTWARAGLDLETLNGARIRVRGFVDRINGPSVELSHIKTIERLA